MSCRDCTHYHKEGNVCRCECFDDVEVYGDIGNEPIKENCGQFKKIEQNEPQPADLYCYWFVKKRYKTPAGFPRFLLQTTCGREIEYANGGKVSEEIMREVCEKCGKQIKVQWVRGME